jgi:hypothetical protein
MLLANIKVGHSIKNGFDHKEKKRTGTSLKNLKSVRTQIQKQERIKKKLHKASNESKEARQSVQLKLEIQKAFDKLRGAKIHDNLVLLKKAEKRLIRKKKKSAQRWDARKEEMQQAQADRQAKRKENIAKYRTSKKPMKRILPDKAEDGSAFKKPGKTRKQRRHENLMKYGPKKTREEREEKRKKTRKDQKKTKPSKFIKRKSI